MEGDSEKTFYIKQLADMLGVTRDTLRIYEESGLLHPTRDANGFRVYTESDVYALIMIRYYRDSHTSIKDIKAIMQRKSESSIIDMINQRIDEEMAQLEQHKKNLARLELSKVYLSNTNKKELSVEDMPAIYILSEKRKNFFDTVKDYFSMGKTNPVFLSCFLNAEYNIDSYKNGYESSYLMLRDYEFSMLRVRAANASFKKVDGCRAIRAIRESEKPVPQAEHIKEIIKYAKDNGYRLQGDVNGYYLSQYNADGCTKFILEIYAPIIV